MNHQSHSWPIMYDGRLSDLSGLSRQRLTKVYQMRGRRVFYVSLTMIAISNRKGLNQEGKWRATFPKQFHCHSHMDFGLHGIHTKNLIFPPHQMSNWTPLLWSDYNSDNKEVPFVPVLNINVRFFTQYVNRVK